MLNQLKSSDPRKLSPTALDLFSGCGGLTLGLKCAGFQVLAAIEVYQKAQETYQLNHSDVELISEDIRKVAARPLMQTLGLKPGQLDLLAGCPPCQGFSRIRTKNRRTSECDARNELIFDFLRFVRAFRPKSVMLENVPALKDDPRFAKFQEAMKSMGYYGEPEIHDASKFGVPQRRKRLIYLAVRRKYPLPKLDTKYPAKTVRDAISTMKNAGFSGDSLHDMPERRFQKTQELIRAIPKNGGSRSDLPAKYRLVCHESTDGFNDVYGRMAWDGPAPTITGGCNNPSKGRFLHPTHDRAITLREASLLQGFPISYRFKPEHGKSAIALMIGNALPPPFIEAHAKALAEAIQKIN